MVREAMSSPGTVKDPVCGMDIDPNDSFTLESRGVTHHFCSESCLEEYARDPSGSSRSAASQAPDGIYTCPMHPEIRQTGPGGCPICGMALEPVNLGVEDESGSPELTDMTRRFKVAALLSAPLLVAGMLDLRLGLPVQLALSTPVVLWSGLPLLKRAMDSVRSRNLNMFSLIGLGVSVAYLYSVVAMIYPGFFPTSYFEAASVI